MAILLAHTAFNLFSHSATTQTTNAIDVIFRTSSAAIFGYFLSGNFNHSGNAKQISVLSENNNIHINTDGNIVEKINSNVIKNKIGFDISSQDDSDQSGKINVTEGVQDFEHCPKMQVYIVASIGILSLIFLLVAKNITDMTAEASASVSQFRDFVSACTGYLVSCGKSAK
jgi:hypothetical protein